jgi:RNA polymerase sigma-B factor
VELNLGLARILARRFADRGEAYDDLFQVASLALTRSIERFDPSRGVEFGTFATRTMIGELKHHFRDASWSVRVPRGVKELYLEIGQATNDLSQELHRSPTVRELADRLGVSSGAVLEAMEAGQGYRSSSIEAPGDDQDPLGATLGEEEEGFLTFENRSVLSEAVSKLPLREQRILRWRFFDDLTQSEIAARVGLSQMQVSRVLSASLQRLRDTLAGQA